MRDVDWGSNTWIFRLSISCLMLLFHFRSEAISPFPASRTKPIKQSGCAFIFFLQWGVYSTISSQLLHFLKKRNEHEEGRFGQRGGEGR